jgi:hypothetical protein
VSIWNSSYDYGGKYMDDEYYPITLKSTSDIQKENPFFKILDKIRPAWKNRSLIERVRKLLPVDASSACQRLFNAAIHDLREKVKVAGLDIAKQAAHLYKLPAIEKVEDIDEYRTARLIGLCYRMGLLPRSE